MAFVVNEESSWNLFVATSNVEIPVSMRPSSYSNGHSTAARCCKSGKLISSPLGLSVMTLATGQQKDMKGLGISKGERCKL